MGEVKVQRILRMKIWIKDEQAMREEMILATRAKRVVSVYIVVTEINERVKLKEKERK